MDPPDTRQAILAPLLARLEAERFAGPRRVVLAESFPPPSPAITEEQALINARLLLDAIGSDPLAAEYAERETA